MDYQKYFKETIVKTRELLRQHNNKLDWEKHWEQYAEKISKYLPHISKMRKQFHEWAPLYLYMTTSDAKQAGRTIRFTLRYNGQEVAELKVRNNVTVISTATGEKDNYNQSNKHDFDCMIELPPKGCSWKGEQARKFRRHFTVKSKDDKSGAKPEHRLESLLLTEFSKRLAPKALTGIQPVRIAGVRYPMPTPLAACNHGIVEYTGPRGGGIDILARVGRSGKTNLCIIELKDQNKTSEPAWHALEQAIKYAVFIRELLRSKSGAKWWKLFGFGGQRPKNLTLYAACAMPNIPNADQSFKDHEEYLVDESDPMHGGDKIKLHYIYFEECDYKEYKGKIRIPLTSLR